MLVASKYRGLQRGTLIDPHVDPLIGGGNSKRGLRMRKTSHNLLSAAAGAALMLVAIQPRLVFDGSGAAKAAASDTYRQLSLLGDGFDRGRTNYVDRVDDGKIIESA